MGTVGTAMLVTARDDCDGVATPIWNFGGRFFLDSHKNNTKEVSLKGIEIDRGYYLDCRGAKMETG